MINEIMGHGNHDVLIIDEVHEWSIEIECLKIFELRDSLVQFVDWP